MFYEISNHSESLYSFWACTGDFDVGLAPEFAEEFNSEYQGCNSHFAHNVRKNGNKTSYNEDDYQKEWEHSLRNVQCLPANEILGKVIPFFYNFGS